MEFANGHLWPTYFILSGNFNDGTGSFKFFSKLLKLLRFAKSCSNSTHVKLGPKTKKMQNYLAFVEKLELHKETIWDTCVAQL